jgi:excisionase family DNA binding protein
VTDFTFTLPDDFADRVAERVAEKLPAPSPLPDDERLAYRPNEAAELISVSPDHFARRVLPHIKVIRSGRLRLIPRTELERWVRENSARLGGR